MEISRDGNTDNDVAPKRIAAEALRDHLGLIKILLEGHLEEIERTGEIIRCALEAGRKLLLCGNGGSAADAQHIAAELVGRYEKRRRAWPAIALTTDTSALTALGNDFGYSEIFARQVEALARPGDVLVAISTSGDSPNVLRAVEAARAAGCRTIGLTREGGRLASLCDTAIGVPSSRTARIQEAHIIIGHVWCDMIEQTLAGRHKQ